MCQICLNYINGNKIIVLFEVERQYVSISAVKGNVLGFMN